jgi:hypothetical protein
MSERVTKRKSADETPNGAEAREKARRDDEAVRETVTAEPETEEKGTKSVLPGPPIPPSVQNELRNEKQQKK